MHTLAHVVWGVAKHVAFGYLVYSVVRHRRGKSPTGKTTAVVVFGVLFPDVVDKPLAYVGVVEYGRSVAHSLLTATVILVVVVRLARRWNRAELGTAFGIGYLSHVPVDMYGPILLGNQSIDTAFLFWPVVVEYPVGIGTPGFFVAKETTFTVIIVAAFCLWLYDRMPVVSDIARFTYARFRMP